MTEQTLICGTRQMSGETLRRNALCAASGFASMGLKAGDAVAVMMRNEIAYLEAMLALGHLGVYLVAVNWHFRSAEAAHVIKDSEATVLLVHADLLEQVKPAVPEHVKIIVVATPPETCALYGVPPEKGMTPAGMLDWDAWRDSFPPSTAAAEPSHGSIIYTSGTTGLPKGVARLPGTPEQYEGQLRIRGLAGRTRKGMRTAVVGPLYHAGPNSAARHALDLAELVVVMPRFDPEMLLQNIERHRLTHLSMVPIMLVRMLKLDQSVREKYDVSSIENGTHGGSPCPPEVKKRMQEWWGPVLYETYGSTEAGLVTLASYEESVRYPGTVGRPFPGTQIRILDPEGKVLPAGAVGEIYVDFRANGLPFTYRNNEELRRSIERDGYITNGDVGYLNEEGYLFISDRKRDMVISGAVNIYPAEIEHVLLDCPGVRDCAVFGIPDEEFGEALAAAVEPMPGAQLTADDVRRYLRERMAGYKVPKVIDFHDALPREGMGKVFKNRLREPYWAKAGRKI
jgi:long-chain acyl-CoA synthetase